jgi:LmbE family N-acetylglucosaminyl deacetylase
VGSPLSRALALEPSDRLLVLAAHPDDESVATGGLLQHALAAGAPTLVVFFTDGDNNAWAQRATELRWRITAPDRARFAVRRRAEARRALDRLGASEFATSFLGFPDQGVTDLVLHGNEVAMRTLTELIVGWRPTVTVGPSLLDLHPDHSALGMMLSFALEGLPGAPGGCTHLGYLVHNPALLARPEGSTGLSLSDEQRSCKRAAIACHRTQLVLRSTWLLSFARREERFWPAESPTGLARHPVRSATQSGGFLEIVIASRNLLRAHGARTVCLVGGSFPGSPRLVAGLPPRDGAVVLRHPRTGTTVGEGEFRGRNGHGYLRIPGELLAGSTRLFAKVEHAFGFFDEAGWKELLPGTQEKNLRT